MESLCQEDIIIKCSPEEMVKAFFEDYVIVWHDPNLNSQENQEYMAQLRKFCEVLTFTEWQKASLHIRETKAICYVVSSGTNGKGLVEEIFSYTNLTNIYIFCRNKEYHSSWAKKYVKVSCVETNIESLLNNIQHDLFQWYKQRSSLKLNLPAFASIFNDGDKSHMNHLHRFLKVIPNFKNREQAKNDFIALSKVIYSGEKNIEDFEKTYNEYNKVQTLQWYTKESFLYKVANNCLRIATSDSIQYCRLLLKDLEQAIKDQYHAQSKNFNGLLYRGSSLSAEEWKNLKENTGQEIEMHGFLSVSREKRVAGSFLKTREGVFITILVPKGPYEEEQGFAEIEEFSLSSTERETLFNVRSRFTVLKTEDEYAYSESVKCRHLVLLYGAQGFRKFTAEKDPLEKVSLSKSKEISCARCKVQIDNMWKEMVFLNLTEKLYYCLKCTDEQNIEGPLALLSTTDLLSYAGGIKTISGCVLRNSVKTPFYGYECLQCKEKKQKRYFVCVDCSSEFHSRYCELCLEDCQGKKHQLIMETNPYTFWCQKMTKNESSHLKFQTEFNKESKIFLQPEMYFESHEYDKAREYYEKYIERSKSESRKNVATAYNQVGRIYQKQGGFQKALEYHLKALNIYQLVPAEDPYDVAAIYYNLGKVSYQKANYKDALQYYFETLKIYKSNHPQIATVYGNIANIYKDQDKYEDAYSYHEKALKVRKEVYGENHPDIASSYNDIGNLYDQQGKYEKALEYHFKSLEIDKSIYGENHPNIAASYNNIGSSYNKSRNPKEALEYHSKALKIYRSVYEENHPNIATCYNNIGLARINAGELKETEENFMKALKIRRFVDGENHPRVATCYNNLGLMYSCQHEYDKALKNHTKALNIWKSAYGDQHPHVATCYLNIGKIYKNQQNRKKTHESFSAFLAIAKGLYGENHPTVKATERMVEAGTSHLQVIENIDSAHVGEFMHYGFTDSWNTISKSVHFEGCQRLKSTPISHIMRKPTFKAIGFGSRGISFGNMGTGVQYKQELFAPTSVQINYQNPVMNYFKINKPLFG